MGLAIGLTLLLCGATASAATPSFDCGKARTPVEKAICRDAGLAKADAAMAKAYRSLSRKLTPSAAALLVQDQKWFLAAQDQGFEFYPKNAGEMLRGWLIERTKFLNAVIVAEPRRLVGRWGNVTGEVEIRPAAGGRLGVSIDTSEPAMARWVCSMTGSGSTVNSGLRIKEEDGSVVTFTRNGQALKVAVAAPPNKSDWTNKDCGLNGSLDGDYLPIAARPHAEDKAQTERIDLASARLSRMASRSGFACLKGSHGSVDCTADGFKIDFGDCSDHGSYGGITAPGGVTLFDQIFGRDGKPVARLADRQLVCIEATATKARQKIYYVKAVPTASVPGCMANALCKAYGDRAVQWMRPPSGEPCRRAAATKAYTGDCASGWIDQGALETFSMGL